MKKTLIVLLVVFSATVNAQIAEDKKKHYAAGVITSAVSYEFIYKLTKNKKKARIGSIISTILVGSLKETLDSTQPGNRFDHKDLLATTLGGISVNITIKLFDKNKKRKKWDNYYY